MAMPNWQTLQGIDYKTMQGFLRIETDPALTNRLRPGIAKELTDYMPHARMDPVCREELVSDPRFVGWDFIIFEDKARTA